MNNLGHGGTLQGRLAEIDEVINLFNAALNTNLNVINATLPVFILHALKSQWTNTYTKNITRTKPNLLHNIEGGLISTSFNILQNTTLHECIVQGLPDQNTCS